MFFENIDSDRKANIIQIADVVSTV
jgi:hypothetical protein